MNNGLEPSSACPSPSPSRSPNSPTACRTTGNFTARPHLHSPHTTPTTTPKKNSPTRSQYILLNAIGSTTLDDGKYLYNPATGQIEVQWIQGIGSEKAAAPQGRLMATVINGILCRKLPWTLVLLGVALVIVVELLGVRSLTFAVGAYLSIATTLAIFVGGVMRWMVDRALEKHRLANPIPGDELASEEISPGSLYASGLIAAGGIVGLLGVCVRLYEVRHRPAPSHRFSDHNPLHHDWVSVLMFALLAFSLYYFARKPLNSDK